MKAIRLQYFHHKIKLNIRKKPVPNFQDTKFVSHKQEWKWRNDAMTIKKKRTKIILPSILTVSLTCGLLLTGCQKTPDQSAVVSKAGGLSEDVIAEPLKDGETQTLDLPEHWDTTVTWSNDRGVFHADQKLESVTTGNLPVIEVSQKKLELEQLNGLISYFAGGEILYQTQELTREYYQNLLDRIKNREGFYADNSVEYDLTGLEKLVEEVLPLAPEQTPLQEIGQIEYTSKRQIRRMKQKENHWKLTDMIFFRIPQSRMEWRFIFRQRLVQMQRVRSMQKLTIRKQEIIVSSPGQKEMGSNWQLLKTIWQ